MPQIDRSKLTFETASPTRPAADVFSLDVAGLEAGILSRHHDDGAYRLFAVRKLFRPLESQRFATVEDARRAALRHLDHHSGANPAVRWLAA